MPNFPSLAEQDALLKRKKELQELATRPAPVVHQKAFPVKLLAFATEGDDAIVKLDLYHGVIETPGRKTFFFDKTNQAAADARWQDYPVSIHYRCDRTSEQYVLCTPDQFIVDEVTELHLFYNRPTSGAVYAPVDSAIATAGRRLATQAGRTSLADGNLARGHG